MRPPQAINHRPIIRTELLARIKFCACSLTHITRCIRESWWKQAPEVCPSPCLTLKDYNVQSPLFRLCSPWTPIRKHPYYNIFHSTLLWLNYTHKSNWILLLHLWRLLDSPLYRVHHWGENHWIYFGWRIEGLLWLQGFYTIWNSLFLFVNHNLSISEIPIMPNGSNFRDPWNKPFDNFIIRQKRHLEMLFVKWSHQTENRSKQIVKYAQYTFNRPQQSVNYLNRLRISEGLFGSFYTWLHRVV